MVCLTFTCDLLQEFMFHSASNGLAEQAVETLKEVLKRMGEPSQTKLSRFLFQYCIMPQTTTGQTPAEMLMDQTPKAHLDLLHPDIKALVAWKQEKQKESYDHHTRE